MRLDRSVGLPLLLFMLGSVGAESRGGDSAAESTLKEKGLAKTGHTFVIEAEKPVLAKMKEIRAIFASYAAVAEKQAAAEQVAMQSAQLEEHRVELQSGLDDLNQQIVEQVATPTASPFPRQGPGNAPPTANNNPLLARRDQINLELAEVGRTQRALKTQAPLPANKTALDEDVKKKQEAFKSALSDLRQQVDEVTKKYADLGADPSVKTAITDLMKASKAKVNLGPSDAFLAGVKELDKAERQFLGKRTPAPSKKKTTKAKK
jgi:hypothetical protein